MMAVFRSGFRPFNDTLKLMRMPIGVADSAHAARRHNPVGVGSLLNLFPG